MFLNDKINPCTNTNHTTLNLPEGLLFRKISHYLDVENSFVTTKQQNQGNRYTVLKSITEANHYFHFEEKQF